MQTAPSTWSQECVSRYDSTRSHVEGLTREFIIEINKLLQVDLRKPHDLQAVLEKSVQTYST